MTTSEEAWIAALTRAALPGAAKVRFSRTPQPDGVSYALFSRTAENESIGDDRDYDLLKAAMSPLERLSEAEEGAFTYELDLETNALTRR